MRVAYVCLDAGVPVFGRKGCSIHVQDVVRAFRKLGAEVSLFAAQVGGQSPSDMTSVSVNQLSVYDKTDRKHHEASALAANKQITEMLDREGRFDLVYERYSLWSYATMEWARIQGIPGVLEVNAPLIEEQSRHRELNNRASAEEVAARVFGSAQTLIAVSEEVANYLERFPTAIGHVHVVPNGVNVDCFPVTTHPTVPTPEGAFTIGFLGTLKPWHGLPVLVEAFALVHEQYPNTRLLIVGDGREREKLLADLRARNLEKFAVLTGAVDHDDVPGVLASMDVAVAPYPAKSDFYFSPLKVYEYMAAGLPVVASRCGQLSSVINHGESGLLCEPGSASSLAKAICQLINDAALRDRLGRNARTSVERNHTWTVSLDRILSAASVVPNCAEVVCI